MTKGYCQNVCLQYRLAVYLDLSFIMSCKLKERIQRIFSTYFFIFSQILPSFIRVILNLLAKLKNKDHVLCHLTGIFLITRVYMEEPVRRVTGCPSFRSVPRPQAVFEGGRETEIFPKFQSLFRGGSSKFFSFL